MRLRPPQALGSPAYAWIMIPEGGDSEFAGSALGEMKMIGKPYAGELRVRFEERKQGLA